MPTACWREGRILVTGGVVGWDVAGAFPDGFVAQVRADASATSAPSWPRAARSRSHLVRLTWYVVDIDEYVASLKELGRAYREIFGAHYPAMAVVQVVRLVEKAARVEIEATAVVPTRCRRRAPRARPRERSTSPSDG